MIFTKQNAANENSFPLNSDAVTGLLYLRCIDLTDQSYIFCWGVFFIEEIYELNIQTVCYGLSIILVRRAELIFLMLNIYTTYTLSI